LFVASTRRRSGVNAASDGGNTGVGLYLSACSSQTLVPHSAVGARRGECRCGDPEPGQSQSEERCPRNRRVPARQDDRRSRRLRPTSPWRPSSWRIGARRPEGAPGRTGSGRTRWQRTARGGPRRTPLVSAQGLRPIRRMPPPPVDLETRPTGQRGLAGVERDVTQMHRRRDWFRQRHPAETRGDLPEPAIDALKHPRRECRGEGVAIGAKRGSSRWSGE
jgi:hypothetical protein